MLAISCLQLYVAGANHQGQLGLNLDTQINDSVKTFTQNEILMKIKFISVVAGENHVLAIDSKHRLYGWGSNNYGQLGDLRTSLVAEPKIIEYFDKKNIKVSQVATGDKHTIAVSQDNKTIYEFGGSKAHFQSYFDYSDAEFQPLVTSRTVASKENYIVSVHVSGTMNYYLTSRGEVMMWGTCFSKMCPGIKDGTWIKEIQRLNFSNYVAYLHVGPANVWMRDNNGIMWAYGQNSFGQLCTDVNLSSYVEIPQQIKEFKFAQRILASYNHTIMKHNQGQIYGCGSNQKGQLGLKDLPYSSSPVLVNLVNIYVVQDYKQYDYDVAITKDGTLMLYKESLYATGQDNYGELSLNYSGNVVKSFTLVRRPVGSEKITNISAFNTQSFIFVGKHESQLSAGVIVGIVFGVIGGIALIAGIAVLSAWIVNKKKNKQKEWLLEEQQQEQKIDNQE